MWSNLATLRGTLAHRRPIGLLLLLFLATTVACTVNDLAQGRVNATPSLELQAPLDVLLGPVASLTTNAYDKGFAQWARATLAKYPLASTDLNEAMVWNYYDTALTAYTAYYRTGDVWFRDQARKIAAHWNGFVGVSGGLGSRPPPRHMSTQGLAVYAVESGNLAPVRATLTLLAEDANLWCNWLAGLPTDAVWPETGIWDQREAALALDAMVVATMMGVDSRVAAKRCLDDALRRQKPDGSFAAYTNPGGPYVPELHGIARWLDAMMLYDRAIGDPRIVPAMQKTADWLWTQHWLPRAKAFKYCGSTYTFGDACNQAPASILNALFLGGWGYLHLKTGDPKYRTQGDAILAGVTPEWGNAIYNPPKHANQMRGGTHRFLGWR